MALDGSYESKLLRLLVGYFHISLLQQLSLTQCGKPWKDLSQEEKDALAIDMVSAVMGVAESISEEAMKGKDFPPPPSMVN